MGKLIQKEMRLSVHPTAYIFLLLSAMLLIPNYPYYVVFFYSGLAAFFTCLGGRENQDVFYSMMLPIAKRDIVRARFASTMLLQLLQVVVAIPCAILRQRMPILGNEVGMDANIAFFGMSFILMGIFNLAFFTKYYKDVTKVGKPFLIAAIWTFVYIGIAECACHVVPFFKDQLDTANGEYTGAKLLVLLVGIVCYLLLTYISCRISIKHFENQDL